MKRSKEEQKIYKFLCEVVDNEELNWGCDIIENEIFKEKKPKLD